jgi:hypothetical protein
VVAPLAAPVRLAVLRAASSRLGATLLLTPPASAMGDSEPFIAFSPLGAAVVLAAPTAPYARCSYVCRLQQR